MPDARPEPHRYECWVRWSDVDAYGHVNNVVYFEYFQEARIMAMAEAAPADEASADEVLGFVVARTVVDYRRPVMFRAEPYVIETRATRIGTSSFDLEAVITDGTESLARSRTTVVAFDAVAQRSRPLRDVERAGVTRILEQR